MLQLIATHKLIYIFSIKCIFYILNFIFLKSDYFSYKNGENLYGFKSAFIFFTRKQKLFIFSFYKLEKKYRKVYNYLHDAYYRSYSKLFFHSCVSLQVIWSILIYAHSYDIGLLIFIYSFMSKPVGLDLYQSNSCLFFGKTQKQMFENKKHFLNNVFQLLFDIKALVSENIFL